MPCPSIYSSAYARFIPDAVPLDLLERVCALHPVLHMNGDEAMVLAGRLCDGESVDDAKTEGGRADIERAARRPFV